MEEQALPVALLAEGDRARGSQLVELVAGEAEVGHRALEVEPRRLRSRGRHEPSGDELGRPLGELLHKLVGNDERESLAGVRLEAHERASSARRLVNTRTSSCAIR